MNRLNRARAPLLITDGPEKHKQERGNLIAADSDDDIRGCSNEFMSESEEAISDEVEMEELAAEHARR